MATKETDIMPHVENPFPVAQTDERLNIGTVSIESERAIAEVKAAYTIAKMFPRNKHAAMEKILEICRRADFAKTALYAYPRGNEKVEGLTIRAAEVIANAWGNIRWGIKELSQADGESEMLAFACDLETNSESVQTFNFKHERYTRNGTTKLSDPRDIYELGANYGARRLRARILAVVDQDVVAAAEKQCRQTMIAALSGDSKKTLVERAESLIQQFGKIGIKVKHIEGRLGHVIADITPEEYTDLGTIFMSLKDGISTAADWFDMPKSTTTSEAAKQLDDALAGKKAKPADNPEDDIRAELVAKAEKAVNTKYKEPVLRATFVKSQLGDIALAEASIDQLNALLDAIGQESAG